MSQLALLEKQPVRHRRRPQLARHAGTAVTLALLTVGMAACTRPKHPKLSTHPIGRRE